MNRKYVEEIPLPVHGNDSNGRIEGCSTQSTIPMKGNSGDDFDLDIAPQMYHTRVYLTDRTDDRRLELFKFLKPLYISVMCFGLMWKYPSGKHGIITLQCSLVLLLGWTSAIKCFFHYDSSDTYGGNLFKKLVIHLWSIQMACGLTTFVYCKHKHIPFFINQWQRYKVRYGGVSWKVLGRYTYNTVVTVNVLLLVSFTVTFVLLMSFKPGFFITMINPSGKGNIKNMSTPTVTVMSLLHTYIILAWMQSGLFTCVLCYLLRREFKQITGKLRCVVQEYNKKSYHLTKISQNGNCLDSSALNFQLYSHAHPAYQRGAPRASNRYEDNLGVEMYRKRHLELSNLCTELDDVLSTYLLFVYLLDIPIICFTIFGFFDQNGYTSDPTNALTGISGLIMFLSILLAVTMCAASLASSVSFTKHTVDLLRIFQIS